MNNNNNNSNRILLPGEIEDEEINIHDLIHKRNKLTRIKQNQYSLQEDLVHAKLGPDFQNAHCLFVSEVKMLLETRLAAREIDPKTKGGQTIHKTLTYCNRISNFNNQNTVKSLRNSIDMSKYHPFEIATIGNLGIESIEESKALIPSLNRPELDDVTLLGTLNDFANLRRMY